MKRTPAAVAVVAVIATGVSVCASSDGTTREQPRSDGSPTAARTGKGNVPVTESRPRPCKGGTYTWSDTRRRRVLDGGTEPQHLTAAEGARFTQPMRRLRTDMASVRTGRDRRNLAGQRRRAARARRSPRSGGDRGTRRRGRANRENVRLSTTPHGEFSAAARHLVEFSSVQLIETDLRHSCGPGKQRNQAVGHVVNRTSSGAETSGVKRR